MIARRRASFWYLQTRLRFQAKMRLFRGKVAIDIDNAFGVHD